MFATRLSVYFAPLLRQPLLATPVPPGAAPKVHTVRRSASTPPPEWPCLEECKTVEEQICRIKTQFLDRGGDINQKHSFTKKSVLYELLTFRRDAKEFENLTALFFRYGAKVDPSEYNDESPFCHIFSFAEHEQDALHKIEVLAKFGVSLNVKNVRGETLLQTAKRIQLSKKGIFTLENMVRKYEKRDNAVKEHIGSK